MSSYKFSGLDEWGEYLDALIEAAEELENEPTVSFEELFPPSFMSKFADYKSIDAFLSDCGYSVKEPVQLDKVPEKTRDSHVRAATQFSSWQEMLTEATKQLLGRRADID